MRKKRLIVLCSILSVLAVMIILASTVFMLSSVKVNFLTTNMQVLSSNDADSIVKAGKFKYGTNILFAKFDKQVAKIEKAYPFAKVHKIERKFPNKAVIHIEERSPACYVKQNGNVYVLDSEFKVLLVVYQENFNSGSNLNADILNCPQLSNVQLSNNLSAGDFENNTVCMAIIKCIEIGMAKSSKSILDLSKIDISKESEQYVIKLFVDNNETYIEIQGESQLENKVIFGINALLHHEGDSGKIIVTDELLSGIN